MTRRVKASFWLLLMAAAAYFFYCLRLLAVPAPLEEKKTLRHAGFFQTANDLYKKGDFEGAIKKYQEIEDEGAMSGPLFYNLGNAFFRKGKIGWAVLYYKKAGRLIPRDTELRTNLLVVKSAISVQDALPKNPLRRILGSSQRGMAVDEMAFLCGFLSTTSTLFLSCGLLWRRLRKPSWSAAGATIILAALFAVLLCQRITAEKNEAVVVVKGTPVRFGPHETTAVFFEIKEGTEVVIIEKKDRWIKIMRPDGKYGWIRDNALQKINNENRSSV